jgi:hypothetical protein
VEMVSFVAKVVVFCMAVLVVGYAFTLLIFFMSPMKVLEFCLHLC